MPINVMVVDDSAFFRRRIKEILERCPELKVIALVENGVDAVQKAEELKPDVITMDYEMPRMDGVTAVKKILAKQPIPILMFSSLTYEGARVTLDALDAGALDYLPKNFESMTNGQAEGAKLLQDKVLSIGKIKSKAIGARPQIAPRRPPPSKPPALKRPASEPRTASPQSRPATQLSIRPSVVLIGASTGGPVALQTLLTALPGNFPFPILLVQHMPNTFTSAFAKRLDKLCNITVQEAKDGDQLRPGVALLAPGGTQMLLSDTGRSIQIIEANENIQYKPSVDITFGSAARALKNKILALVLTGMGQDGLEGCKLLKREGSTIWTQDEASCVVYGMPMAVARAGYSDQEYSIDRMRDCLQSIR